VVGARQAQPSERGEEGMMRGMHCGGGGRGVAPFYRVGERRWRPVRWVLTPPVSKVLKRGGGDSTGSWLDEGRGRGGAMAWLLVANRRGAAHNGGGRSNGWRWC
jgi:hypothetical protein